MEFIDSKIWKPIHTLPGFECCIEYYVNAQGDVKSTKGTIERLLKHKISRNGYPTVNLTQRIGRKKNLTVPVHKLVALAFLGNPPTPIGRCHGNSIVKFKDENKRNCNANNLTWEARGIKMSKIDIDIPVTKHG